MRALYISHTGMLEGLGRSQVLPYLRGLAQRDVEFDLLSFELPEAEEDEIATLRARLAGEGIRWAPLRRARDSRLRVKLQESAKGVVQAFAGAVRRRPAIVHGRSYFPTAIADVVASAMPKARLLFDCRGMLGDEFVDAGHWTRDRLEYRLLKRYEARALRRADGVVFLTDALRRWMKEQDHLGSRVQVETIPCCVDLEAFRFDDGARTRLRAELGWQEATVLVYSGSLGSWYREDQIARLAGILRRRAKGDVRFLLLTRAKEDELVGLLRGEGFAAGDVHVRRVRPDDMAAHLSAGDVGFSFIKSCFSKKGSSPTKVAEYLACGLPVVLNGDIGDQADLATEREACVVLDGYSDAELERAAARVLELAAAPVAHRVRVGRDVAERRFGLGTVGIPRYERLYRALGALS